MEAVHERKPHKSAQHVITVVHKRVDYSNTLKLFMRERNHTIKCLSKM